MTPLTLISKKWPNRRITAEIHAHSLANFYRQHADRHVNLKFMRRVSERKQANSTICYRKNQIDVSLYCVCPVNENEFRHNIVKIVCGSTRLSPRGFTATLTTSWRNSGSITGQTHRKLTSICQFSHDVTAAILVFLNNETAAMLV